MQESIIDTPPIATPAFEPLYSELYLSSSKAERAESFIGTLHSTLMGDFRLALEIHYHDLAVQLINYVHQTMADERQLPVDPSELKFLPAEQFTQPEIPVLDFQESNIFQIHRARYRGRKSFRNSGAGNDWLRIQAGGLDMYGELRGRAVARMVELFKIRNVRTEVISRLAFVPVLDLVNGGRFHGASRYIRVCRRRTGRDMRIIDIGVVVGQAHVVPYGNGQ